MKQCPKCNSSYADDSLRFCLIDGTSLVPVFDSEATHIPAANPAIQPTIVSSGFDAAPAFVPPSQPRQKGFNLWLIVIPVLGIGLILLLVVGVLLAPTIKGLVQSNRDSGETSSASPDATPRPTASSSPSPKPTPKPELSPPPPPSPQPTIQSNSVPGNYPEVSTRPLTGADVAAKSCFDLKIMRNEAYARHGYIFQTRDMSTYFSRQTWYRAQYEDVFNMITPMEKRNVEFIKSYEAAEGCK